MILDQIIELENKLIKAKNRLPKKIKISYSDYCKLVKEIEASYFLNSLHNIPIEIIPTNRIILE
jgi:hypothetical protein